MSLFIAPSDSIEQAKDRADIVCTGVDDQEQFEAAINLLPAAGGCLEVSEGNLNMSANLTLGSKPVVIRGAGPSATVFNFNLPDVGDGLTLEGMPRHITLADFGIKTINQNLSTGLRITSHTAYSQFDNLWIEGASTGVYGESGYSQCRFDSVRVRDCNEFGFMLYGVANSFNSCLVSRSGAMGLGGIAGFHVHESGSVFVGSIIDNLENGFYVASYANGISVHGVHAERCGVGIRIQASEPNQPKAVSFYGGLVINSQSETEAAICIGRSESVKVRGVHVAGSASGEDVSVSDSALHCAFD